jgi:glycosyltransferase involved in cell wall biosynthesis
LKKAFSHLWVSGIYQFEYARKLGFDKKHILLNALSCSSAFFSDINVSQKEDVCKKRLLFVGRFVHVKGIDLLIEAWKNVVNKDNWELIMIGDGPLKNGINLNEQRDLQVLDYMSNDEIILQMRQASGFILPSRFEPWGVVLHEAVAIGLPVIATNVCGTSPHFVINNYNGFITEPNITGIHCAIQKLINLDHEELGLFSHRSKEIASGVTPEKCVASLVSIIK